MAGWARHEYLDQLTGDLMAVEVVPEADCREHVSSEECECIPTYMDQYGTPVLIHNSFDGREDERGH